MELSESALVTIPKPSKRHSCIQSWRLCDTELGTSAIKNLHLEKKAVQKPVHCHRQP